MPLDRKSLQGASRKRPKKAGAVHDKPSDLFGEIEPKPSSKKIAFSPDWHAGADVIAFGAACGLTEQETSDSFSKCKDYFVHGRGSREKRDEMGWMNRVHLWIKDDGKTKQQRAAESAARAARYSSRRDDRHAASFDAAVAAMRNPQADIEAAAAAMMAGRQ